MHKYDRLLFILNLLRSHRNLGASRLASECGVTERTIYRDMIALAGADVPIYYDRGYKLASTNFLPPLNLDFSEYNLLRLALESSPLYKTGAHRTLFRRVKAKVEAGLTESVKKKRLFTPRTTHIEVPISISEEKGRQYYTIIEQAIVTNHCLQMQYNSIDSGLTDRIVEPYFIVFRGRAFYFVALCQLRNAFRTFRIDRVEELRETYDSFVRRDGVDAESYFEGSWELYSDDPVEIVIIFSGKAARVISSSQHHSDESIAELEGDRIEYRVKTRGIEEIRRWILGFGSEAEVLAPTQLRDDIAEAADALVKLYNSNPDSGRVATKTRK